MIYEERYTIVGLRDVREYLYLYRRSIVPAIRAAGGQVLCLVTGMVGDPGNAVLMMTGYEDATAWQDAQIASLMGEEQLWIKDGWHAKFDRPADSRDAGFGHAPEQVAAFESPDIDTLLSYNRAVVERSKGYFNTLSKSDLDRELDEPRFQPLPTVGVRLISIMDDSVLHAGQAAYVRGLRQGRGWQKY